MKNKFTTYITLVVVIILALTLRLYRLDQTPHSLTWDETALGYNSYSLLLTGKDEYGTPYPLILRSFDDYKPALYAYLSLPIIKYIGASIYSIRLLSAISGSVTVCSLFFLAYHLTRNKTIGLLASLLASVSPLLVLYSRMALEANLALALFTGGLAFITAKFSRLNYATGLLLLTLSAYAYHSPRYVVPMVILLSFIYHFKEKHSIFRIFSILVVILAYIPIIRFTLSPEINTRFKETSVFTNTGILFGSIAYLGNPGRILTLISKTYLYLTDIFGRYLSNFNPFQLFVYSSGNPSYRVDDVGIFTYAELPFWIGGMVILFKQVKKYWFLLPLYLIIPLPSAITTDWFAPHRSILLWPLVAIVTAIGAVSFVDRHKFYTKPILLALCAAIFLYSAGRGLEATIVYHPYVHAGAYQFGFADTVSFVNSVQSHYSQVIVDSPHAQPHIFFLFYSLYPPDKYQQEIAWRVTDHGPRTNFNFGPYIFRKIYWPNDRNLKHTLFVGDVFSLPYDQLKNTPEVDLIREFHSPDGNITFRVVGTK